MSERGEMAESALMSCCVALMFYTVAEEERAVFEAGIGRALAAIDAPSKPMESLVRAARAYEAEPGFAERHVLYAETIARVSVRARGLLGRLGEAT